ncbi:hypothetical protein CPB86DRAFT_788667 [Serendipita vermifera]|nr:hypothetical protein CPB86DRAFT_788667 [Serendipita vermifera]
MKEVPFDDGKVLVARLGDKVVSTSAYCTHYGASLAKGVLTADGRVVCPWHGACFNVCTGDIEDAPALHAIHSFKAHVDGGKIHVTADPKYTKKDDNLVRQPTIATDLNREESSGVVIVGGGAGTIHAIESLRETGYKDPITVLTKEHYPTIDRTKLSKALPTQVSKVELRPEDELRTRFGVDLKTGVVVTSVNTTSKTVTFNKENETVAATVPYTNLILAPGSHPRRLPIPGGDLSNVYTLRYLEDAQKIDAACKPGSAIVVIGTSFISMEVAGTISKRGMKSIDMVGMEEVPFEAIMGKEVGAGLQVVMGKGINFHMSASVESIEASSSDPTKACAVKLKDGTRLEADVVITGVGVAPATEFLKDNDGIKLEKDGGVIVDEYLRVIGVSNVYAIGDIAIFPQVEEQTPKRIEHWNVASNHGRAAGRNIAGQPLPFTKVPIFWSAQGLRYCGLGGKANYDEVYIKGKPSDGKFVAYYIKNDKVMAVCSMGFDPVNSKSSELMRVGAMPSGSEIKAGADVLQVDISTVQAFNKVPGLKPRD